MWEGVGERCGVGRRGWDVVQIKLTEQWAKSIDVKYYTTNTVIVLLENKDFFKKKEEYQLIPSLVKQFIGLKSSS